MTPDQIIAALNLETAAATPAFASNPKAGTLMNTHGRRAASLPETLVRSLRFVLEKQRPGAWAATMQKSAAASGQELAGALDDRLRELHAPQLAALPFETSLELLVRLFALHAWGTLALDTSAVDSHGLVVAHVEHDFIAGALRENGGATDPFVAGVLQGFFEHLTGQALACAELTGAGAARSTFVLTTPDRLAPVQPQIGREPAEAILARLKAG